MYRVLIADDEIWSCEALNKIIRETAPDFRVEATVHDGEEAFQKLKEEQFDIIITDIRMPNKDGLKLIQDMVEVGISIPVIIISGFDEFKYAQTAVRFGVFDYLLKPISRSSLSDALDRFRQHADRSEQEEQKLQSVPKIGKDSSQLPGPYIVKQIEELIRKTYYEDHSLSAMGFQFDLNPAYLGRLFRAETGVGFICYLTDLRMERAKSLLATTMMSIVEISQQVGYWDDKHFIKMFKKTTGLTPSQYRTTTKTGTTLR